MSTKQAQGKFSPVAGMRPLAGIRVLTVEQFGAGPYGTMFLADLGAEVIKVENAAIGGDPGRYSGPFLLGEADSEYFQSWNIGKRSVSLDLKSAEGREALLALVRDADAVVNNLRGDQPEKLKIDYASLKSVNPAVVCLHISAYGRDNDRKSWPGYDFLMQAEAGLYERDRRAGWAPDQIRALHHRLHDGHNRSCWSSKLFDPRETDRPGLRRRRLPFRRCDAPDELHRNLVPEPRPCHRPGAAQRDISPWRRCRRFRRPTAGSSSCA